ncbi:MAG: hypothetical protein B6244_14005, partial [Candidatus Cloacimonetes bacterium 4572_55]
MAPEIRFLSQKWAKNPKSRVFVSLAEAYRKTGKFEDAIGVCHEGLKHKPKLSSGYVVLGRCLAKVGKKDDARDAFEKVIKFDPVNMIALKALGDLYDEADDPQKAFEFYQKAADFDPFNDDIQQKIAELRIEVERLEAKKKTASFSKSDSLSDDDEQLIATPTIAELYAHQGHIDKAIDVYEKLLAKEPGNKKFKAELALLNDQLQANDDGELDISMSDSAPLKASEIVQDDDDMIESFSLPGLDGLSEFSNDRENLLSDPDPSGESDGLDFQLDSEDTSLIGSSDLAIGGDAGNNDDFIDLGTDTFDMDDEVPDDSDAIVDLGMDSFDMDDEVPDDSDAIVDLGM